MYHIHLWFCNINKTSKTKFYKLPTARLTNCLVEVEMFINIAILFFLFIYFFFRFVFLSDFFGAKVGIRGPEACNLSASGDRSNFMITLDWQKNKLGWETKIQKRLIPHQFLFLAEPMSNLGEHNTFNIQFEFVNVTTCVCEKCRLVCLRILQFCSRPSPPKSPLGPGSAGRNIPLYEGRCPSLPGW